MPRPRPVTYTVAEVAEIVDRDPETVRRWIRSGYLDAVRIGREYRISAVDLNAWWRERGGGKLVPALEWPDLEDDEE